MDNIKTTGAVQGTAKNPADVYGKPNGPTATPTSAPTPPPKSVAKAASGPRAPRERKQPVPPAPVTSSFRSKIAKGKPDAKTVLDIAEATIENGSMQEHLEKKDQISAPAVISAEKVHPMNLGTFVAAVPEIISVGDAQLAVRKKLSYSELIQAVEWCVNVVADDRTFVSAPLAEIIEDIAILKFFSNLDVSEVDQAYFSPLQFYRWYDVITSVGAAEKVREMVDKGQQDFLHRTFHDTLNSIIAYRNSVVGIIDALSSKEAPDADGLSEVLEVLNGEGKEDIQTLLAAFKKLG